ncbi:MAG: carbohydrate ABC transporter permease, partial [Spirochaetes bacterium]
MRKSTVWRIAGLTVGVVIALLWMMPLIWSVVASLRPINEPFARGHVWFGSTLSLANYIRAFQIAPFGRYFINTVLMVTAILSVQLVTSSLAGFAFA